MKNVFLLASALAIVTIGSTSCGDDHSAAASDSTATVMNYSIDPATSKLTWAGTMIGVKTHTGVLNFTSGNFTTDKGMLTAGDFVVDMKSYTMTDTNYAPDGSEQGTRAMLMGHLMSGDFLAADSFPTASLRITGATGNTATCELTVRGKVNTETITDIVITPNAVDSTVKATGKLTFDRQKYGVAWSSGSKDYVLGDNIDVTVELSGKAH